MRFRVTADVKLPINATQAARWLPASALFQQAQQTAVWVVGTDNKVTLRPITVLAYQHDGISISDLPVGTKVIAAGVHKLNAGQVINPIPYDGAGS
ncbi:hypothetical protein [Thiothrix subterranea]|uniref:hypothetical protein n=1 Tax=Thiothrix subterranea TaxID=2735563 RepID=UPI00280C3D1A|nr:hypothetical protein [Thiothrix subterranea]